MHRVENHGAIAPAGRLHADRSVLSLLFTNLVTIAWAMLQHWSVSDLMWVYWGQGIIIGWFNVHRIVDLDRFTIRHPPLPATRETQRRAAVCFAMHYGMFHLGYGVFLLTTFRIQPDIPLPGILVCLLGFYFNHRFSYRYNLARESNAVPNVGTLMFFPYARIFPMHLMTLLGAHIAGNDTTVLVLFLLLKTAADVAMHILEHGLAWADSRRVSRPRF